MPSSTNQVADGQRDGLLLLQKRFLSKGNLSFFAETTISNVQANMTNALQKPFAVNFSNASGWYIHFLPSAWPV